MASTLTKTSAIYARTPDAFKGEHNDCTVRALAIAANVPYARAHAAMARAGRKPRDGAYVGQQRRAYRTLGAVELPLDALTQDAGGRYPFPTVAQVLRAYPVGRLLLRRNGHAFAAIDGVVHDWAHGKTGLRSRVRTLWIFPGAQHRQTGVHSPA